MQEAASSTRSEAERPGTHLRGILLVGAASLLWSSGGLIVRSLETADSWTIVFWRGIFATAFLLAFIAARERGATFASFRRVGWPGLVIAGCYAVASTALIIAFKLTSVANTLIIMASAPFMAAVLARLVLGERVRPVTWGAMAASIAGIAIMVSESHAAGTIAGDMVAMLIAIAQAIAGVIIRRHRHVQMAPAMCLSAAVMSAAIAPLASPWSVGVRDMALLAFFGAGQLGLGLALFSFGAPLIPVAEVALLNVLEPIFGPFWVWMVLGERPGNGALIGGAIVLAALTVNILSDIRPRRG